MSSIPDFRNGAISLEWRAAIEQLNHPAHMSPEQWELTIELAHQAAVAALSTFYQIATSSRDIEISTNAVMNGGELAKLMLGNLQESMVRFCEQRGGGACTFSFAPIADESKGRTVQ